jgi:CMP/dCMP kinase
VIVAVDGPAGSGKSSVCRGVAQRAQFRYLDTGAMYRAMTWAVLNAGVEPQDADAVLAVAKRTNVTSTTDPVSPAIAVDGFDVSEPIRSEEVTNAVSAVSAVPQVREILVAMQQAVVEAAVKDGVGIVVEGRDIGTVVLPNADLKIFLTADPAERARRRAKENHGDTNVEHVDQTKHALLARDHLDSSRAVSPLKMASDARELDTTHLGLAEVIDAVLDLISESR